jgi:hypothetical protein
MVDIQRSALIKKGLILAYVLAVICILVLVMRMFIGGNVIMDPDAMLPMTYVESSSLLLAMGALPMIALSVLLYQASPLKKKGLILVPSLIPVSCFVIWLTLISFEFLKSMG